MVGVSVLCSLLALLADMLRAKRARRVESPPFLLVCQYAAVCSKEVLRVTHLLICLCLNEDSFWLAGLMMASEGLT